MSWVNFRFVDEAARWKMRLHNAQAFRTLEDAEIRQSGGLWFRREAFPGCLDHLPDEKPSKHGQMFRF